MPITGSIIIENFGWGVSDADFPGVDVLTGEPTGEMLKRKVLLIAPADAQGQTMGLGIEIRIDEDTFVRFVESMTDMPKVSVVQPGAMKALPDADVLFGNGRR